MLVKLFSSAVYGINATSITIEVNIFQGIKYFIVGLPDNAVKESLQRIESTLKTNGFKMPLQKVIINLAPADIKKEGSSYDLPIAIGILAASGQMNCTNFTDYLILGELSLDGLIQPVRGILPIALQAKEEKIKNLIVPAYNAREAAVVDGINVFAAERFIDVVNFLDGKGELPLVKVNIEEEFEQTFNKYDINFSDVKGQDNVKRALEIAAAGGHNVLMIGPPGAGKTMLAKRIPTILPPLTIEEALETTKIHSVAGLIEKNGTLVKTRPFRSPHHTISDVALVGGGTYPQPGEISIAHNGVLFLDELPEFKRSVLEVLRQPLEDRVVTISRAKFSIEYPASFMLVASMNPCPCGYYNHPEKECVCTPGMRQKYLSKISGPLLDRIDIHLEVVPVPFEKLSTYNVKTETSEQIRERVVKARKIQQERYKNIENVYCNSQINGKLLQKFAQPDKVGLELLKNAMNKFNLSARAYDRILKLARTIADLAESEQILPEHVAEAIQYRCLDREDWIG
ncbi:MAG: YifB family Mg chelatase-like AAA ATPase [Bacteroidales bacterium]|nr:YifB family Mg chelatase-like AAA ATPase [Bacteroidales bacterium]